MVIDNNSQPLVSVIIPCFNHVDFVQECIKGIISQSYQNLELIIIDDGSNDESVRCISEMAPACQERFFRFEFRQRENKGLCATINEACDWITGELVAIIASDDVMLPNRIDAQAFFLTSRPEIEAVFGGVLLVNADGKIIGEKKAKDKTYNFNEILFFESTLYAPTMLIRNSALQKALPLPIDIYIEDRFIQLCITKNGGAVASINCSDTRYRVHQGNSSKNIFRCYLDNIKLINLFTEDKHKKKPLALNEIGCATSIRKIDRLLALKHLVKAISHYPYSVFRIRFIKTLLLTIAGF